MECVDKYHDDRYHVIVDWVPQNLLIRFSFFYCKLNRRAENVDDV